MHRSSSFRLLVLLSFYFGLMAARPAVAQLADSSAAEEKVDQEVVKRIRQEGLERSKAMETASFLTDVHGPRLTGSPQTRKAGEWAKGRLTEWGLANARLETWGEFGRGWSLDGFVAQMVAPQFSPLIAYPKAWSPSTPKRVRGTPIYLDVTTEADLEKYRGKLSRAIVLLSAPRDVAAQFEPPGRRLTDEALLALANAAPGRSARPSGDGQRPTPPGAAPSPEQIKAGTSDPAKPDAPAAADPSKPAPATDPRTALSLQTKKWQLIYEEGAAVVLEPGRGDGGTVFVGSAYVPGGRSSGDGRARPGGTPWSKDCPPIVPQFVVAVEQYNRIVRMLQKGAPVELEIDLASRYHDEDLTSFNVLAEIPGGDLADQVVMLGAHFDSWHTGTGATDNAVGCTVAMEAVRILQAIGVKPRRTIRIGLWTGEEQGILGSKAYVEKHFGKPVTSPGSPRRGAVAERGKDGDSPDAKPDGAADTESATRPDAKPGASPDAKSESQPEPKSDAKPDGKPDGKPDEQPRGRQRRGDETPSRYELTPNHLKFSAYFNLDNGTGKIRGVYLQGNEAVRPIFRSWLAPFADLGASTLSSANTGGTDHLSFDRVGLPGFQFIQDPVEYSTRTHHSSMDVYDRLQAEDVKQASVIMATFVYLSAMRDEQLPRKPLSGEIVIQP